MDNKKTDKIVSAFILMGMAASIIIASIIQLQGGSVSAEKLILTSVGALCGVISTVLAANASILNFVFGLLDVSIYSIVLWDNAMWSQFALHALYFLPMQFVGFFLWRKKGASASKKVKTERLSGKGWGITAAAVAAVFIASGWLSYFIGKGAGEVQAAGKTCLDAGITTMNIVALVLMSKAYVEQWYLWVGVNVLSITIWLLNLSESPANSYTVVLFIKYVFYLLNSINAIRIWLRLSKAEKSS